jgi:hypothetical protein
VATATVVGFANFAFEGELFYGNNLDQRILDKNGNEVRAVAGDFRLAGRLATGKTLSGTGVTAKWGFALGRASNTFYLVGDAKVSKFGIDVTVKGDFAFSNGNFTFHLNGDSEGQVDVVRSPKLSDPARSGAYLAAKNADSDSGHDTITFDPPASSVDIRLAGRASYRLHIDVSSSSPHITLTARGVGSINYVELPSGNEEARSKWTKLLQTDVHMNTSSGLFCFNAPDPMPDIGDC